MINKLFQDLQLNKANYLNSKSGNDFENRIATYLKMSLGLNRILKDDIDPESWKIIQEHIKNKLATDFIDIPNERLKRSYIYQPYGSQQFPDYIVFTDKKVVPLEIKFSSKSQSKPIWNSNVPKANAFYIFGSYGLNDITFFCGDDIITEQHRKALYGFFEDIRKLQNEIREEMPLLDETNRGFTPYIRSAFDQRKHKKTVESSFFSHSDRKKVEDLAINKSNEL
jgi:hypothetical protein